jgi:hypothetical protein
MTCNGFPQAEPLSGRGLDLGKACVWHVQRVYFVYVYWDMLSQVPIRFSTQAATHTETTFDQHLWRMHVGRKGEQNAHGDPSSNRWNFRSHRRDRILIHLKSASLATDHGGDQTPFKRAHRYANQKILSRGLAALAANAEHRAPRRLSSPNQCEPQSSASPLRSRESRQPAWRNRRG